MASAKKRRGRERALRKNVSNLDFVLGFLGRCNEDFGSVMCDIGGGSLHSPTKWVMIIEQAADVSMGDSQIIDNIGPLVRCMCDDVERKFFGSTKYWHESILPFIGIIHNMLKSECNFIKLSQYKGLFEMIVQSWFWEAQRRDIVDEFNTFASTFDVTFTITKGVASPTHMTLLGGIVTFRLLGWVKQNDDAKNMLGEIGSVPIVSRKYDPNCKVSLTVGIIRYIKSSRDRRNELLTALIRCADCVDKDVISEMIDYGTNFTFEYEDANVATQLIFSMITRKIDSGDAKPNDSRTAFAIRAGLLLMCMDMIARFGGVNNARRIMISVSSILRNIYLLSFHKKTWKAIGAQRGHLIKAFNFFKENQQITNNDCAECKQALCFVQSIIHITSTSCFVCKKETERKDMKKCAACKSVCYCSEECQREDWHSGGHDCGCEIITDELNKVILHSLDTSKRDAAKLKDLERNIMMAQKSLFLEHAETIRLQLAAEELPCSEYVAIFDLEQCPLAVTVMKYNECLHSGSKNLLEERSDGSILCIYQSPFFSGKTDTRYLVLQRLFPVVWIPPATNAV